MAHASPTPCIRFGVRFKAVAFRTSVLKQVNFSSQGELSERSLRHRCAKCACGKRGAWRKALSPYRKYNKRLYKRVLYGALGDSAEKKD